VAYDTSFSSRLYIGSDITTNKRLFTVGDSSMNGNLFAAFDTSLNSRLVVGSDITTNKRLFTVGDASLNGNLFVAYDTSLNSRLVVGSDVTVNKRLFAIGDASFNGNLFAKFDTSLNSRLVVGSDVTRNKRLFTVGDASLNGNLIVMNETILNGPVTFIDESTSITNNILPLDLNNNFITNWTLLSSSKSYRGVAMSANGQYQLACVYAEYLYLSTNHGISWTAVATDTPRNWTAAAMSANGKYQSAALYSGTNVDRTVYYSSNYGVTWAAATGTSTSPNCQSIAMSSTGKYQVMADYINGVYVSYNYGEAWFVKSSGGNYQGVACSATGKFMLATKIGTGLYYSNDYGNTWSTISTSIAPGGQHAFVAMSSNGKYCSYTTQNNSSGTGYIYRSSNYGSTWTAVATDASRYWQEIRMSADGEYQIAGLISGTGLYKSVDYGVTWILESSVSSYNNKFYMAISSNAQYVLLSSSSDGKLNQSITPYNNLSVNGNMNSYGNLFVNYDTSLNSRLVVGSDATVNKRLFIVGDGSLNGNLFVIGDASFNKRLFVGSDASFGGNIGFNKIITVSPNSTNATSNSWFSSGITWTANASTFDSTGTIRNPYKQFNSDITYGTGWGTSTASYNTTSPFAYKNTTYSTVIQNSVGTVYGEWLQIASNVPVTLNSFYLYNIQTSSTDAGNAPGKYYICGSSDGTTWYPIIYVNYTSYPSGNNSLQTPTWTIPSGSGSGTTTGTINTSYTVYGNSNTAYIYFTMVITNCVGNLGTGMVNNGYCFFGEWNMSFTVASSNNLYLSSSIYNTIQSDNNLYINGDASFNKRLFVGGECRITGNTVIGNGTTSNLLISPGYYYNGGSFVSNSNAVAFDLPSTGMISFSDNVIFTGGNVGIGTANPTTKLEIDGQTNIKGANVINFGSDQTKESSAGKIGYGTFTVGSLDIVGAGTSTRTIKMWDNVVVSNRFSIGTQTATAALTVYAPNSNGSLGGGGVDLIALETSGGGKFRIGLDGGANSNLTFMGLLSNTSFTTLGVVGYVENDTGGTRIMNFTGQHRCAYDETINSTSCEGLIVNSTGEYWSLINEYDNTSQIDHITINESLPKITITKTSYCKSVFGVISFTEDTNKTRKFDGAGRFVSIWENPLGEKQRVFVNSLGEGGIWVCNSNGIFSNGDYITSSNVPGYGMVQDNGQMMNYTVGKITCDCDFKPKELPVFKVITNTDGTTQTITAVDSFGNIITKPAYKIRYLKPDGTIIPQDIYNEMISNSEPAYIAAFIGCTYHCG
jgi:predicted acyltransferase (DUF342 family)/transcriptional antiterminator Rof (Rho-off)